MGTMSVQETAAASPLYANHRTAQRLLTLALCALLMSLSCLGCAGSSSERSDWRLNESAVLEEWRVTVLSVSVLPQDPYRQPADGHVFVAVQFRLENRSTQTRYVMPERQMALLDGDGQVYAPHAKAAVVAARTLHWLIPEGEFPAGAAAEGTTSFQVPIGAQGLRWVFRTSLFPGAPTVTFSLGDAAQP